VRLPNSSVTANGRPPVHAYVVRLPGAKGEVAELMNSIPTFVFTRGASVTPRAKVKVVTGEAAGQYSLQRTE
jgi:hypothetical protein